MKAVQVFDGAGIDPHDAEIEVRFDVTDLSLASGMGPDKDRVVFEVEMKEQATRIYNNGTILRLQQLEAGKFKIKLTLRIPLVSGGYLSWHERSFVGVPSEVTAQHVGNRDDQGNAFKKRVTVLLCR